MTTICYKLTDQNMRTYNDFQWELDVERHVSGDGKLCGPGWLHVYDNLLLAVFLNPIHANIQNPRAFCCECRGKRLDDNGLKCGYTSVKLIEEVPLPDVSINQRIAFGILCALEVYHDKAFEVWANRWLDSTTEAARVAAAEEAAWVVARAVPAATAAWVAARAEAVAAKEAAKAAAAAVVVVVELDLIAIAKKAMQYE